jgi:hypothetical protein
VSEPIPRFFFSYRRADASAETGRLRDALAEALREHHPAASAEEIESAIFLDVVDITAGRDFQTMIERTLSEVTVVIAVIGPRWRGRESFWSSRIRSAEDWVRRELEVAHVLPVAILPVRVDGARPLRAADLPESLRYLLRLQTPELRNERWDDDVAAFMRDVIRASELVRKSPDAFRGQNTGHATAAGRGWRLARIIALGGALLGVVAGLAYALTSTEPPSPTETHAQAAKVPRSERLGPFVQRQQSSGALAALAPSHDSRERQPRTRP